MVERMFGTAGGVGVQTLERLDERRDDRVDDPLDQLSADGLEQALAGAEAAISRLRHTQLQLLRRLDVAQVAAADGSRTLPEWVASRLDVAPETAKTLVWAARHLTEDTERALEEGKVTLDRAVAVSRLRRSGAPQRVVEASAGWDIAGIRRAAARWRHLDPPEEICGFENRYAAIQLNLDATAAGLWARLSGPDTQVITQAIQEWADRMPTLPDGSRDSLAHRQADALVAICHHALGHPTTSHSHSHGNGQGDGGGLFDDLDADTDFDSSSVAGSDGGGSCGGGCRGPQVLLTADLGLLADSGGTAGATVVGGPRLGVHALEEALCNGSVALDVTTTDGTVLGLGASADPIPPRIRRHVLARDGGCAADGCHSRYRLQVHHIVPRSQGGTHHPDNLVTLCWYHHHVVVHGKGYAIDPDSPPLRQRFIPPTRGPPT
jgi:hypothetical protein